MEEEEAGKEEEKKEAEKEKEEAKKGGEGAVRAQIRVRGFFPWSPSDVD